jgi:hypothetical protein
MAGPMVGSTAAEGRRLESLRRGFPSPMTAVGEIHGETRDLRARRRSGRFWAARRRPAADQFVEPSPHQGLPTRKIPK